MIQSLILFLSVIIICVASNCILSATNTQIKYSICDRKLTEAFRGVAILLIMIQHLAGHLGTNIFTPFGGIGVTIFLVLSGFGLNESLKKNGINGFITKKFYRIWLPFFLFYAFLYLYKEKLDIISFIKNIFSIEQSGYYWYIHYLLRCYITFWIISKYTQRYKWLVYSLFITYSFFATDAPRAEQCLSFPMGVLLSDKKEYLLNLKIKNATVFLIIFSFIGVTCLLIKQLPIIREYFDTYLYYFIELGIKLPLGLSMILFLWILPSKYVISPFVTLCGVLSYELYLVHMQMLSNVGTYVTSALMIILLSLLISYSMHFAILFFTKNVR